MEDGGCKRRVCMKIWTRSRDGAARLAVYVIDREPSPVNQLPQVGS